MAKFHINAKGVPSVCKATKGNCPFGGADSHFDSIKDAQESADKRGEEKHGVLPGVDSSEPRTSQDKLKSVLEDYKDIGELRKTIDSGLNEGAPDFNKPANWDNLGNKEAIDLFLKKHGANSGINKTVDFFEEHGDFRDINRYSIKDMDSRYGELGGHDDSIYDEWRDANHYDLLDNIDDDYMEYNFENFHNKMADVYIERGNIKSREDFQDKIIDDGFFRVFNEFRKDIYEEGRAESTLRFLDKNKK